MGVLDDLLDSAPSGVVRAIHWLLDQGAETTDLEPRHGMGFALAEFALDGATIRIVSDRDHWSLDARLAQQPWLQLDLIHDVRTGEQAQWPQAPEGRHQPGQLPQGVEWVEELPRALTWLRSTPDAVEQVEAAGRERARRLFPRR
ncbi:MAG: hypothetical protein GY713_02100 [Actinomycetia bacterium]|nr:hypothetical protein [Actinomycetes bacterium]